MKEFLMIATLSIILLNSFIITRPNWYPKIVSKDGVEWFSAHVWWLVYASIAYQVWFWLSYYNKI